MAAVPTEALVTGNVKNINSQIIIVFGNHLIERKRVVFHVRQCVHVSGFVGGRLCCSHISAPETRNNPFERLKLASWFLSKENSALVSS